MRINEFLLKTTDIISFTTPYGTQKYQRTRKRVICNDGFSMSVQAGESLYCTPRVTLNNGNYSSVEIGFPSQEEPLINGYAEDSSDYTETVYGYVPVELVDQVIEKHGGISNECLVG